MDNSAPARRSADEERVFDAFRRWGYLQADLDPLGFLRPAQHPELQIDGETADEARRYYCGTVGVEFMHIPDPGRRQWIAERIETESKEPGRRRILERLVEADLFEQVIQSRYLGTKRFSLEGVTALIPLLDEILEGATEYGAVEAVVAMSHRGRLNVMTHIAGKAPSDIFAKFEDVDPRSVLGGGDVKYHIGATGDYAAANGKKIHIHLVSNPSHLEAVDPVAIGRTRAKQVRYRAEHGEDGEHKFLPVMLHGDGAFAGQGILAETLNLSELDGYSVGGTVHVIVNNLIGFTTTSRELHSSRFASDVAKRMPIPVFHVNAEDPDEVVRAARIALDYRYTFASDVVIDLIGYRCHGHSEVDDPTITQPRLYKAIKEHPPLWQIYAEDTGQDGAPMAERVRAELEQAQREAQKLTRMPTLRTLPAYWSNYRGGKYEAACEVDTGVARERLAEIGAKLTHYPPDFHIHPKVKRLLEQRAQMASGRHPVDYGMAEALAFGSLVLEGTPVRLSGQDSRRGTFNQRHSVLIDIEDESEYLPLQHLSPGQARFEAYNSELSEAGVLGFEYGYSRDYPETLVLWEAQFGDFANGAQIIVDQFISAGEDKWGLLSGVVLLLPHGYEGQGPEHSSARIERYLQLAAKDNMQIAQPSTAAQYFHLLRRQALRSWRKPLVIFTPKSMLRHPDASSTIEEFSRARFLPVVTDDPAGEATRVLVCTGKIGHDVRGERKRIHDEETAILFLDQLYPFPETELADAIRRYRKAREIVWVQEEPANMGALWFALPRLKRLVREIPVRSVKRSPSSSPATGSAKAHELEQEALLALAFAGQQ